MLAEQRRHRRAGAAQRARHLLQRDLDRASACSPARTPPPTCRGPWSRCAAGLRLHGEVVGRCRCGRRCRATECRRAPERPRRGLADVARMALAQQRRDRLRRRGSRSPACSTPTVIVCRWRAFSIDCPARRAARTRFRPWSASTVRIMPTTVNARSRIVTRSPDRIEALAEQLARRGAAHHRQASRRDVVGVKLARRAMSQPWMSASVALDAAHLREEACAVRRLRRTARPHAGRPRAARRRARESRRRPRASASSRAEAAGDVHALAAAREVAGADLDDVGAGGLAATSRPSARAPLPSATMAITAATPMTTPSMVSAVRRRLRPSACAGDLRADGEESEHRV